jgi:cytochrome c biogenesis protein CcdA
VASSEPNTDEHEAESSWDPELFATEMLDGYFARPVVVAALVAKGVDSEVARALVVKLQKDRYLKVDLEKKAARRFQSRCLMAAGATILLISIGLSFYVSGKVISREGGGFVIYWGPICTGFFILLYGFSKRRHF